MKRNLIAATAAAFLSVGVHADEAKMLEEIRGIGTEMPRNLVNVLMAEIDKGGHAEAISVCREKAPQMAKNVSEQTGWQIRRVSLKNRNPKAVPDDWERTVLEDFDRRLAAGEPPASIDKSDIVTAPDGKKVFRYMKALPTQELCLNCHGTSDKIKPEVQAKLKELYPEDKATGYGFKQVRGALTAKKTF